MVLQVPDQGDKNECDTVSAWQSRRPNLSSLQVPTRSLEYTLQSSSLARAGPAGLPPRPNSTRTRSSKSLLPQRSLKTKSSSIPEGDRTILLIPGTPTSEGHHGKPYISRQFSLSKVLSSISTKRTHSLPSTPIGNSGSASANAVQDRHVVDIPTLDVSTFMYVCMYMLSVI